MSAETNLNAKLGYREYACLPQDGRQHEVIDGRHIVNLAPNTYHQTLSRRIQFEIYTQIELRGLGVVYDAPTDLQLTDYDIVQPDLIVVLEDKRAIITPIKIKGTPDLIVEILSAASAANDRGLKKTLYQQCGVREYWIVDPDEHVVEQYLLRDETYELAGRHAESVVVQIMDDVRVDLSKVW